MKKYAHIDGFDVVNVSLWDGASTWNPKEKVVEIPDGLDVGVGWNYVNGKFKFTEKEGTEEALISPEMTTQEIMQSQQTKRQKDFQAEADPLFFKWQAGESTQEEWQAKRQEIRERYPYPEE